MTRLVNNSEEETHGVYCYLICTGDLCVSMLDFRLEEIDNKNIRGARETTHITLYLLQYKGSHTELRVCY